MVATLAPENLLSSNGLEYYKTIEQLLALLCKVKL
jgi:hypothetical protein